MYFINATLLQVKLLYNGAIKKLLQRHLLKKVFKLTQANKHPDRVLDSIKYDLRRYLKRERKKKLPEDAIFWEFDCMFGKDSATAVSINSSDIISNIDKAKEEAWEEFYIQIISKPSDKVKKKEPKEEDAQDDSEDSQETQD